MGAVGSFVDLHNLESRCNVNWPCYKHLFDLIIIIIIAITKVVIIPVTEGTGDIRGSSFLNRLHHVCNRSFDCDKP